MRSLFSIACFFILSLNYAQSAIDLTELLGRSPKDVDLREYIGTEIDTIRSATWRYSSKQLGALVQAHIDQNDSAITVITTITLYFTKKGYGRFAGKLPYGLRPSKSWNKNRKSLYRKDELTDLIASTDMDEGRRLKFKAKMNDQLVFITALYLNNSKGLVNKEMYSLQFSILE